MNDNVILQSLLLILVFTGGGVVSAFIMKFIYGLLNKNQEADAELTKIRNIQIKIYQVAVEALQGMRLTTNPELYKANYRAFRDALTDADVMELESKGIWRAKYMLSVITPTVNSGELPDDAVRKEMADTEKQLLEAMSDLLDEDGSSKKKSKKKK